MTQADIKNLQSTETIWSNLDYAGAGKGRWYFSRHADSVPRSPTANDNGQMSARCSITAHGCTATRLHRCVSVPCAASKVVSQYTR
jgi:hypothetical protein